MSGQASGLDVSEYFMRNMLMKPACVVVMMTLLLLLMLTFLFMFHVADVVTEKWQTLHQ